MKIDRLTANIRPMPAYQAIELGFAVAREWYGELWRMQAGIRSLMLWVIVGRTVSGYLLEGHEATGDLFLLWLFLLYVAWVRPLFEMPILAFLSQKLFDERVESEALMGLLGQAKKLRFAFLLRHRFGVNRPMMMAVRLLEGQAGTSAKTRLRLLRRGTGNAMFLLSLMFAIAELVLFFGGIGLFMMVLNSPYHDTGVQDWLFNSDNSPLWFSSLIGLWYVMVVSVLSPFFVAAGFCVYLCRRSLLEGWDIELVFRQMAARYQTLHLDSNKQKGGQSSHKQSSGGKP